MVVESAVMSYTPHEVNTSRVVRDAVVSSRCMSIAKGCDAEPREDAETAAPMGSRRSAVPGARRVHIQQDLRKYD